MVRSTRNIVQNSLLPHNFIYHILKPNNVIQANNLDSINPLAHQADTQNHNIVKNSKNIISSNKIVLLFVYAVDNDGLGDNIITLDALFAAKRIYNAHIVVFARKMLQELLIGLDFVDEFVMIEGSLIDNPSNQEAINTYACDYLITDSSKKRHLQFFAKTNAKHILTATKLTNLFHPRFKTVPIYWHLPYRKLRHQETHLLFVRLVDSALFDKNIAKLDFTQTELAIPQKSRDHLVRFLADELALRDVNGFSGFANRTLRDRFTQSVRKPPKIIFGTRDAIDTPNAHDALNALPLVSNQKLFLIFVNPFSIAATTSLHLQGFFRLIEKIAVLPYCIPVVATYPRVHSSFMEILESYADSGECKDPAAFRRCIIYHNNKSIHNLAALLEQMSFVISPSTGTLHLASNLLIPTIGIVSKRDTKRWGTPDGRYVVLQNPLDSLTNTEEKQAIESSIIMLKNVLQLTT